MKLFPALILSMALVLAGCGRREQPAAGPARAEQEPRPVDTRPVIAAFGDSLSAGYGVPPGRSYPDCLQRELDRRGCSYRVVNAGVSGDTTTSGLVRIDGVIALRPVIVILEFGGNDGLRGIPVRSSEANLEKMIVALRKSGSAVVLAGMTLPPNYGPDYIRSFEGMYATLAARHKLPLIPFLLAGVGGNANLMQDDGIHPNAEGSLRVAAGVFKVLEPLLTKTATRP
jgi:acyl-CoA thioesterase I